MAILNEKPSNYDTDAFQFLFDATHARLYLKVLRRTKAS